MTPQTLAPPRDLYAEESLTLYDIETALRVLTEIDAEALSPELRAQYEGILIEAVRTSVEKRDRVAWRLFDLGQRAEVKRAAAAAHRQKAADLERSADAFDRQCAGLKDYVLRVMSELPKPKRGVRTLEGTSATFKAKAVVDAVEITDEETLPDQLRTVTLTMTLARYRAISGWAEVAGISAKFGRAPLSEIKEALQKTAPCNHSLEGECGRCKGTGVISATVPGARLITDRLRLEVS